MGVSDGSTNSSSECSSLNSKEFGPLVHAMNKVADVQLGNLMNKYSTDKRTYEKNHAKKIRFIDEFRKSLDIRLKNFSEDDFRQFNNSDVGINDDGIDITRLPEIGAIPSKCHSAIESAIGFSHTDGHKSDVGSRLGVQDARHLERSLTSVSRFSDRRSGPSRLSDRCSGVASRQSIPIPACASRLSHVTEERLDLDSHDRLAPLFGVIREPSPVSKLPRRCRSFRTLREMLRTQNLRDEEAAKRVNIMKSHKSNEFVHFSHIDDKVRRMCTDLKSKKSNHYLKNP